MKHLLLTILIALAAASPLLAAGNPDVDKKLSGILREFEVQIKSDKDVQAAFDKMTAALKDLQVPARAVGRQDAKNILAGLQKLAELKKSGKAFLPDFQTELIRLNTLDLTDYPQTKRELTLMLNEIKKLEKTPKTASMLKKGVAPTLDTPHFEKGAELTRKTIEEEKKCPSCAELAAKVEKAKADIKTTERKIEQLDSDNEKILKANKAVADELRKKQAVLRNKAKKLLKDSFEPLLFRDTGSKESKATEVALDGKRIKRAEFIERVYGLMTDSICQVDDPIRWSRDYFGKNKIKNLQQSLGALYFSSLDANGNLADDFFFSELFELTHQTRALPDYLRDVSNPKEMLDVKFKAKSVLALANTVALAAINKEYVALFKQPSTLR